MRQPRLLRRLHLQRGGRAARRAGRHRQDQDARRPDPAPGLPGGAVMASSDHEPHTLAGAYVMDAVTDAERIHFARHLADCAECRDEVRELHEATARLGAATAVRPRSALKDPTIRAAYRTAQLPPAVPAAGPT